MTIPRRITPTEIRLIKIDAMLEHLQQVKAETVKLILSLQKERDRKKTKSSKPRKTR